MNSGRLSFLARDHLHNDSRWLLLLKGMSSTLTIHLDGASYCELPLCGEGASFSPHLPARYLASVVYDCEARKWSTTCDAGHWIVNIINITSQILSILPEASCQAARSGCALTVRRTSRRERVPQEGQRITKPTRRAGRTLRSASGLTSSVALTGAAISWHANAGAQLTRNDNGRRLAAMPPAVRGSAPAALQHGSLKSGSLKPRTNPGFID